MYFLSVINIKKSFISTLIILILFTSCLTLESDMKLNSNGSGNITLTYIIDKELQGISNLGNEDNIVPLNLSEQYIQQVIGIRNDIKYRNYNIDDNSVNYQIKVTFDFESIEALNSILPDENKISILKEGNETVLSQGIVSLTNESINDETLKIFRDLYKDHYFKMVVRVPNDIIEVKQGLKTEERVAVYKESFIDVISSGDKKNWSIRW